MEKPPDDLLEMIVAKLDAILHLLDVRPDNRHILTAKEVARETGLDPRTILNRSNLPPDHPRFIPSRKVGARSKRFERKVIERIFDLASSEATASGSSGRPGRSVN